MKCVYAIAHQPSGAVYVGGTTNLAQRWKWHRARLAAGLHPSPRMNELWAADGGETFELQVLEAVPEGADLIAREQHWIDELAAVAAPNFNTCPIAGSVKGRPVSERSRTRNRVRRTRF